MRLEIHLVGGDEETAIRLRGDHKAIYDRLLDIELPVLQAVNLEKLLHGRIYLQSSEETTLQKLTTLLDECRGLQKIPAIKHLRENLGCGLRTAKDLLDQVDRYNTEKFKIKDEKTRMFADFIQQILEIFGMEDSGDDETVLDQFRKIKEELDAN